MAKVGITAGLLLYSSGTQPEFWKAAVNDTYVVSVEKAGGVPLVLPVVTDKAAIRRQVECIDALVLSGGEDVDPILYGEEHFPKVGVPNHRRDQYEWDLLTAAWEKKIPILAICRGMQMLNVFLGGTLYQDMDYCAGAKLKHDQTANRSSSTHKVRLNCDSKLYDIFQKEEIWVNSFHHQSVKDLGKGLKIVGLASDGVVEAMEYTDDDRFLLAVQWHPETLAAENKEDMGRLFEELVSKVAL